MQPTREDTLRIATEIVSLHVGDASLVGPDDHFERDLELDSLSVLEVMAALEERLDVTIPTQLIATLRTVRELAQALPELRKSAGETMAGGDELR